MTTDPIWVRADAPVRDAAQKMAHAGVGSVIVVEGDQVLGICTDRDITVRVTATGRGPDTPVLQACSEHKVIAICAAAPVSEAAERMRRRGIRRLPVVRENRLVGIVTLADLTAATDSSTTLGGISQAPPNR